MSTEETMDDQKYAQTQNEVMLVSNMLQGMDLVEFLNRIRYADTMGPILDPTLWIKAGKRMQLIEEVAFALQEAKVKITRSMQNLGGEIK